MDCFPEGRRVSSSLEFVKTFHKTPALLSYRVRCGKAECACATGEGHGPYWYLRWREGAVRRCRYVRQSEVEAVRAVIEERQRHDRKTRWLVALALGELRGLRRWLRDLEAQRLP
jgi:hypothetical protein